jgi:MerR family transcriptional regulator, redox-sensitive transcriptional activator SoxR
MAADQGLLPIGEVARRSGLRPSALRYYEQVGLLRPAARVGGQRRYHPGVVAQLAVMALCQQTGFTLAELAELFQHPVTGRRRWQALAERKLVELDEQISKATTAKRLLEHAMHCGCAQLEGCELVAAAGARQEAGEPSFFPRGAGDATLRLASGHRAMGPTH